MPLNQKYISNELTHLFGRRQEEKRLSPYETLHSILSDGVLSPYGKGINFSSNVKGGPQIRLSENTMYNQNMICFCDIPFEDLGIHKNKYGGFGVSFSKDFVVGQGGAPVFYIPKQAYISSSLTYNSQPSNKGQYFDRLIEPYRTLFFWLWISYHPSTFSVDDIELPSQVPNNQESPNSFEEFIKKYPWTPDAVWQFLNDHLFSFLKFFDHNLPDNDEDNYYFEREWRVLGGLKFKIKDVRTIIIPKNYEELFHRDFPGNDDRLKFSDEL